MIRRTKTMIIAAVCSLGIVTGYNSTIALAVTPAASKNVTVNKLATLLTIDSPKANSVINSDTLTIKGWAISGQGISRVDVYIDGNLIGKSQYGISRPDVKKAFPSYANGDKSGFSINVSKSKFLKNLSTITVEAVGKDNSKVRKTITVKLNNNDRITTVDSPSQNSKILNKDLYIKGWALNPYGVKAVKVTFDGKYLGNAVYGKTRADVGKAFPGYTNSSSSGFDFTIKKSSISQGNHVVLIETIGNDGVTVKKEIKFSYSMPIPHTFIDTPSNNAVINDKNITISGWAVNPDGVGSVKVSIDGKYIKNAVIGIKRPDVAKAYPSYQEAGQAGYSITIDKNMVKEGTHTITIEAMGKGGINNTTTKKITMKKPATLVTIDVPKNKYVNNNTGFNITGWALSPSGVKTVRLYVDNVFKENAQIGLSRSDVNKAIPGYPGGNTSGYKISVDVNKIKAGTRSFTIEVVGNDGMTQRKTITVEIKKPPAAMCIDTLKNNDIIMASSINIAGWALNGSSISNVKVYLDNSFKGNATIGLQRLDVEKAYSKYNYYNRKNSGFNYNLDVTNLPIGKHTIKVTATGLDGSSQTKTITIRFGGNVNYKSYSNNLDYYVNLQVQKNPPILLSSGQRTATKNEIKYEMDPNNFIKDETYRYMFLDLHYTPGISVANLNKVLANAGVLKGKGQVFLDAAKAANINPIYLVSHAIHETGWGTSELASGVTIAKIADLTSPIYKDNDKKTLIGYKMIDLKKQVKVYNMFGIGAYDNTFVGRTLITGTTAAYNNSWFTVDAAIKGGANWIGKGYINDTKYNQNTLYKMKWDLIYGKHQYATDVSWARKQTENIKELVDMMDSPTLTFEIPKFK